MKQVSILLFALVFTNLSLAQSNSLQEGNNCFAKGDYACAITKYKTAINLPDARQKKIAGDNLKQAEKCFELRKIADATYNDKNYNKAIEYYQSILFENPNDEYAKSKLNEIKLASTTLDISKHTLLISNFGGKEFIYVTTNSDSYAVGELPYWCTVQKFEKIFSVTCTENKSGTERTGSFTVTAGSKNEIIKIRQFKEQVISLSVSNETISFNSNGGKSDKIFINTNASKYSISFLPSWCSIETYSDYFIVTCGNNDNLKSRSDWFKVIVENKELKLNVTQSGNAPSIQENSGYKPIVKKNNDKYYFFNFGATTNDLEKLENVMITMGGRKLYVRLKFNPQIFSQHVTYSTNFLSNKLEISNTGKVLNFPSSSGYYYMLTDRIANNRQAITIGTSFGSKNIRFYFGGGYGERLNLWNLNLNSYNTNQNEGNIWAKNINQTWKGIEAECGLFLKFGHLNIMGGSSVIFDSNQRNTFIECHLGLGFSTR